jgi:predicted nucleic acid-binding protein
MTRGYFLRRRRVFLDTSSFVALANDRDSDHQTARRIERHVRSEGPQLFTSNFIVAETHALLLSRMNRQLALRVIQAIKRSPTRIERVTVEDERRALEILVRYDDKEFSYTDATCFAVMERFDVDTAFTFDRHFIQYGFRTLAEE